MARRADPSLIQINAESCGWGQFSVMWNAASTAPLDLKIELAVIDHDGTHALVFACKRTDRGWARADTGELLEVNPTHWRPWAANRHPDGI